MEYLHQYVSELYLHNQCPDGNCGAGFFWTNGQIWTYDGYGHEGFGEEVLMATGQLHLIVPSPAGCIIGRGSWTLVPNPDSGYPRTGSGALAPKYDQELDCGHLINFGPNAFDDAFWIDVLSRGSNNWTGAWYWANFGGTEQGTFVARRDY